MRKSLLGCLFLGLLALQSAGAWAAGVTLRPTAEVRSAAIRLSDVFKDLPEGKDCDIAIAPAPGRSVTYEVRVLTSLAQQYALDWTPQGLSDRSVLTRVAAQVTSDMIRRAILEKMTETQADKGLELDVQFDARHVGLNLPAEGALEYELLNFSYDAERRRFRGEVMARAGGSPVTQAIAGHIVYKREVPVLARALPAGTVIGESDIKWTMVDNERLADDMITRADQLIGMELRRNQGEDERLRLRDVLPPRLVLRGALVTIKVETPLMLITAQGRALQDGAKGDTVRLINTQSNRTIEGVVESSGVVRVGDLLKVAATQTEGAVR